MINPEVVEKVLIVMVAVCAVVAGVVIKKEV